MRLRRVIIERFRGIKHLSFCPGTRTLILGPNNAGKSTVLEALDLLLHPGIGRPRPLPAETDYYGRDPAGGFRIEAVLGELTPSFLAEVRNCLEGWHLAAQEVLPEPDGAGIEPVVRVHVLGTPDLEVFHEFSKPEVSGARFGPRLRRQIAWVFDGRARDPGRQLAFYQGGLLDRLFSEIDLDPALDTLRSALDEGAGAINTDPGIETVLSGIASDLRTLGLLSAEQRPQFEVGSLSRRELLQALRLGLPAGEVRIPLAYQGRGAQRLVLVAVLLRLAQTAQNVPPIGAFEEPEEALEPLRQSQLARMLARLADSGGQILLVTHSPEIVRAFALEDILLMKENTAGGDARPLAASLSSATRQGYERWLDGPVVRGLFARVPLLVEGPGDRSVFETFWRALAQSGEVPPADQLGIDPVNCEGAPNQPQLAAILDEAGKTVVVWAEQDTPDVLARLEREGHCSAILAFDPRPGFQNLEQALAQAASLRALAQALAALATDRGYTWSEQRLDLVSRSDRFAVDVTGRAVMKTAASLQELLSGLPEPAARALATDALAALSSSAPFSMKGGRQARIVAEAIVAVDGVPPAFAAAFRDLAAWLRDGASRGARVFMRGH
jgi:putative ATP-dependent endonuclease of OLD family